MIQDTFCTIPFHRQVWRFNGVYWAVSVRKMSSQLLKDVWLRAEMNTCF